MHPSLFKMLTSCLACLQGGGEVIVKLPIIRELPPISLTDEGMVKRIRGIAHSMKVR